MNGAEQNHAGVFPAMEDQKLLRLQLRIAQRADELAQSRMSERNPDLDLQCWLEAEREILNRCGGAGLALAT